MRNTTAATMDPIDLNKFQKTFSVLLGFAPPARWGGERKTCIEGLLPQPLSFCTF